MYGAACFGPYVESLMGYSILARQYNLDYELRFFYGESLIQRARNYLADEFLRSSCSHLLFIDADIQFEPLHILSLQAAGKEVVCGLYPKKKILWDRVKKACEMDLVKVPEDLAYFSTTFAFNLLDDTKDFEITDPVEVFEGATGFMLIERSVFEKYREAYPESSYTTDNASPGEGRKVNAFFDCQIDPISNRYLSEDYYFCKRVREMGIGIWVCPWVQLGHIGTHMFQGDLRAMSAIEESMS